MNDHMSTACTLAYHGMMVDRVGTILPCCVYQEGDRASLIPYHDSAQYLDRIRRPMHEDFQAGKKHPGCDRCYHEESLGAQSLRTVMGMVSQSLCQEVSPIHHLHLRLGNVCNLKCMMCWPDASSALSAERYAHRDKFAPLGMQLESIPIMDAWWTSARFRSWFEQMISSVRTLAFTGGEPLLIPEVLDFLDIAVASNPGIRVILNTNLTVLPARMLDVLEHLPQTTVIISLEGTGAMNDYIRYPSDWHAIDRNIAKLQQALPHIGLKVNHTVQHATAYSLPDLAAYCQARSISLDPHLVAGNADLSWNSVPSPDIAALRDWIARTTCLTDQNRKFFQNLLQNVVFDPMAHARYRRYTDTLDQIRGTCWNETFRPSAVDSP